MRAETAVPKPSPTTAPSLYDALGGRECLERVHKRFYDKVFFQGVVPVPIKELARLRLSTLHGCAL